jgi:hypothetical protein
VSCPSVDIDPASLPSTFVDERGDGEEAFRYTAPAAGFYSVRVTSDAVAKLGVCVHDGPRCEDRTLGCNTAADRYGAEVIRELAAGQVLSLVVTLAGEISGEPGFTLDVQPLAGATCSAAPLDFDAVVMTVPDSSGHRLSSSCAPAGDVRNDQDSRAIGFKEARFTLAVGANEICNVFVSSSVPVAVYALEESCAGPEVACALSAMTGTSNPALTDHTQLELPPSDQPKKYLIAIEPTGSQFGAGMFEYGLGCIQ